MNCRSGTSGVLTKLRRFALVVTLPCLLTFPTAATLMAQQHKYTVVDLGTLGGTDTYASHMNSLGHVTGSSSIASPDEPHAFLYKSGKMFDLGPTGLNSSGTALNNLDQIVGIKYPPFERSTAVLFAGGTFVELGTMGGVSSYPYDINNLGQIVMCAERAPEGEGFLYSTVGQYVTSLTPKITSSGCASAINSSGQLAGGYRDSTGAHAFFHDGTRLREIGHLGGTAWAGSWASAMNDKGLVVGTYLLIIDANNNATVRGFLYRNGRSIDIGDLGSMIVSAYAINNHGEIVGSAGTKRQPDASHAFLLTPGHKMLDLNKVVPKHFGWTLTGAISINDRGQILANGNKNGVHHAFLLSPQKRRHH